MWGKVPRSSEVIALEVGGQDYASEEFAEFIQNLKNQGESHLVFLVGPPEGFSGYQIEVDHKLSLSKMTYSHQTVRLLLAEQIYRAINIIEGKQYAK